MKITFLYPRWTGAYGFLAKYLVRKNQVWPPLNLAVLGALAEQQGHQVTIIDGEAEMFTEDQMLEKALATKPDLFGLTCYSPFFHVNLSLAKRIKKSGCKIPIMAGGPHITIMGEQVFFPEFDFLFLGEAEVTFTAFLEKYQNGEDLSQTPGLIFRKANGETYAGQAAWIIPKEEVKGSNVNEEGAMDEFPFPARHLLPMDKYFLGTVKGRKHFTAIQTKRGCPWKCIFCASAVLNTTRVITRTPESIVREIREVVTNYPFVTHFYFNDDVLTLFPEHIKKICQLLIAEGLNKKITFEGATRANLVDEELLILMKEAGLSRLSFGLETVDSEMRKTMKKKVLLDCYQTTAKLCKKHNVDAFYSVMIGLPGETRETVKKTLKFLREAREIGHTSFSINTPYPGTEMYDIAAAGLQGIHLEDKDFANYKRYGSAVISISNPNDPNAEVLTPQDLLDLQGEGFSSIYSAYWRWIPIIRKQGILGFILIMSQVISIRWKKLFRKKLEPVMAHPKD